MESQERRVMVINRGQKKEDTVYIKASWKSVCVCGGGGEAYRSGVKKVGIDYIDRM